eukprot:11661119-Prorocentrum_lima.AAC.1
MSSSMAPMTRGSIAKSAQTTLQEKVASPVVAVVAAAAPIAPPIAPATPAQPPPSPATTAEKAASPAPPLTGQ